MLLVIASLSAGCAQENSDLEAKDLSSTQTKIETGMNQSTEIDNNITDLKELRALADAELQSGNRVGYLGRFFDQSLQNEPDDGRDERDLFESEYLQKAKDKNFYIDILSVRVNLIARFLRFGSLDEAVVQENKFHRELKESGVHVPSLLRWSMYSSLHRLYYSYSKKWEGELSGDARKRAISYLILAKDQAYKSERNDLALSALNSMMGVFLEVERYDQVERYFQEIRPLAEKSKDEDSLKLVEKYKAIIREYNRLKQKGAES